MTSEQPAIRVTRDLPFGEAVIGYGGPASQTRPLLMDVYEPTAAGPSSHPVLMLAHGGAYHRGSKELDEFEQDGSTNTSVAEYCQRFARRGYVCFSIGYRLTQERAAPQAVAIKRDRSRVARGRIDHVRELLKLAPASDQELLNGIEGAFADVAMAARFVYKHAERWHADPARIAIGGFSAGAFSAAYAAYALGAPVAAVVSLSGGMDLEDAKYYLQGAGGQPPALVISSEFDLPGVPQRSAALADCAQHSGLGMLRYFVPGAPHFYSRNALGLLQQSTIPGAEEQCTVEAAIKNFLDYALRPASRP